MPWQERWVEIPMEAVATIPEGGMDWHHEDEAYSTSYVAPVVIYFCKAYQATRSSADVRLFEIGCGNGSMTRRLFDAGFTNIVGLDASESGLGLARKRVPRADYILSDLLYEPPAEMKGSFDFVVSTEVIEHLYSPAQLIRLARKLLKPTGCLVLSTPYNGYLKNVVIALLDKSDVHFQPWYEGGHIKFWSKRSLRDFLLRNGFSPVGWRGAGRVPLLWKSLIVAARCTKSKISEPNQLPKASD
jgi:2-polyprenyl-3-methyl-5-hydroxy-6-metoxy-1,4-benzoquinol methylase